MSKGYLVVEGHGEVKAAQNLVTRLWQELELPPLPWSDPIRWPGLHKPREITRICERIRRRTDAAALLIIRDEDDRCPQQVGPCDARLLEQQQLPFPASIVLFHREYEVLFLPCIAEMAGKPIPDPTGKTRPGIVAGAEFTEDPESIRDVKGWLSNHFPADRIYKPTLDQLPLTRMVDFDKIRSSGLPCFGTLERALGFLAARIGEGGVYPPSSETTVDC